MTLVKWDPFRDLRNFQRQMGSSVEDSYGTWAPAVDIFEKGDDLVISAEVPGLSQEDIEISVENNVLSLRGERKRTTEFDEQDAYRLERSFGVFTRSFALPKTVDSQKISATYKQGVLEVRIPKAAEAKPRKIEIQVA